VQEKNDPSVIPAKKLKLALSAAAQDGLVPPSPCLPASSVPSDPLPSTSQDTALPPPPPPLPSPGSPSARHFQTPTSSKEGRSGLMKFIYHLGALRFYVFC